MTAFKHWLSYFLVCRSEWAWKVLPELKPGLAPVFVPRWKVVEDLLDWAGK